MSAAAAAAAAAVVVSRSTSSSSSAETTTYHHLMHHQQAFMSPPAAPVLPQLSRYESQKRRDWITFGQYLKNHRPPLNLSRCSGAHVLEFLRYLDQFGKTKVHGTACPFYGHPNPPAPCPCPLKQAWGSLDALIGRLRAAFEENGGLPETNPFGARAVRLYLREVRDTQAKARGIAYEKKKRKKPQPPQGTQLQLQHEWQHEEQRQRGHFIAGYGDAGAAFGVGSGGGGGGGGGLAQPNGIMLGGAPSTAVRGSLMPLSVFNC